MSTNREPSAMRRKAGAGRPPPEIGQLTPARALRAALAQAAQEVAALVAVAGQVEEARITRDPLTEALPQHPLIALVEGPGGRFGLFVLDPQTVAALIEIQTTGRVVPRPAELRAPTRTDAIMCADFIDRALELMEARLVEAGAPEAPLFAGFRYAMALDGPRAIAMTLDDVPYRRMRLGVEFAQGAKSGEVIVVLPHDPPGRGAREGRGPAFTEALRANVLHSAAWLAATLARRPMTLAEVSQLAVGSTIVLPREVLGAVAVEDLHGRVVARGRLGQADGHRAVRLLGDSEARSGNENAGPAVALPDAARRVPPAGSLPGLAPAMGEPGPGLEVSGGEGPGGFDGLAALAAFAPGEDDALASAG